MLAIFFITFGVILLVKSNEIWEITVPYHNVCTEIGKKCEVQFEITEELITGPIFFMYRLTNFYQNHRLFVKSISKIQLREEKIQDYSSVESCEPVIYNHQNFYDKNVYGDMLNPDDVAFPCGLIARSYFNDTFMMFQRSTN